MSSRDEPWVPLSPAALTVLGLNPDEVWMRPKEAAALVPGADALSMRKWAANGLIRGAYRLPSGRWQLPRSGVIDMLEKATPTVARPFIASDGPDVVGRSGVVDEGS